MTPKAIGERAASVTAVRADTGAQRHRIANALVDVRAIRAWADAREAALVGQLTSIESFPEATIAESNRCSLGAASKTKERSDTLSSTPTLAEALEHGAITAGHVDTVTRHSKQLDDDAQRREFLDRANALSAVATAGTIEQFGKRLDLEVKRLQADGGDARLVRQQRNTRMSSWTDGEGMWNVRGRFDPVAAVRLAARLDSTVQTLSARATPALCPSDPIEKSKFLATHAFIHLVAPDSPGDASPDDGADAFTGSSAPAAARRPEYVAVIEADAPGGPGPVIDFSIPVEIPPCVLAELAGQADVIGVVVRNGVVLHAPGELNLGRSNRLANRPQRRALRALYRCCAIPGCSTAYDRCKLHHLIWWRHGGRTDLDNLLPVCAVHHAKIHNDGWIVEVGPNRELRLSLPDGRIQSTGAPSRRSAA